MIRPIELFKWYFEIGVKVGEAKSDQFLRYFSGGSRGVRRRFGNAFRKKLIALSPKEFVEICEGWDINPEIANEIRRGDYRRMDSEVINLLTKPFLDDVGCILGEPGYSFEQRKGLLERIYREEGFECGTKISDGKSEHSHGGDMNPDTHLSLYLAIKALREL